MSNILISGKLKSVNSNGIIADAFNIDNSYITVQNQEELSRLLTQYEDRSLNGIVYVKDTNTTNIYNNGQLSESFEVATKEYADNNYVQKSTTIAGIDLQDNITKNELTTALNNDALSVNDTADNIQAIITSNSSSVEQGNLSAIISSDVCTIGDLSTDKNGRQTIISSKNSETNSNDTAVIATRESAITVVIPYPDHPAAKNHSTESAIIGGYGNEIQGVARAVIAGGSVNTIRADYPQYSGDDSRDGKYAFIGGGQNNAVRHRNAATIGGQHLTTTNPEQVLVGRYNKTTSMPDNDILFAVGTGTSSAGNNGFWVSPTKTFIEKPEIGSPLLIFGGDSSSASKIMLDQTQSGQITNNGTNTLFGFTSNSATDLKVGHINYTLSLRGSGDLSYNGNVIPIKSYVDDRVKANPTGAGTTDLTKLEVGGTVYNISSGKVYRHSLYLVVSNLPDPITFVLYSASSTRITINDFYNTYKNYATLIPTYYNQFMQYTVLGVFLEPFEDFGEQLYQATYSYISVGDNVIQTIKDEGYPVALTDIVTEL